MVAYQTSTHASVDLLPDAVAVSCVVRASGKDVGGCLGIMRMMSDRIFPASASSRSGSFPRWAAILMDSASGAVERSPARSWMRRARAAEGNGAGF